MKCLSGGGLQVAQICKNCGKQINSIARFCPFCGAEIKKEVAPAAEAATWNLAVAGTSGCSNSGAGINQGFVDSLNNFLRNPRQMIPLLFLALFWFILSLLAASGINPWMVRFLSFLTFAQGGMYGGVWGAMGGIIGKAVFAYFFTALITPVLSGKSPFKGMTMDFRGFFNDLALQGVNAAASLFLGTGLALIAFNFFTGNASTVNSMAGIVGFLLALKALFGRVDLLKGLVLNAANKLSRGKTPSALVVNRVITGYAAGSALAVVLTAFSQPYLPYLLGIILFLAGLILGILFKAEKVVPAA